MYQSEAAFALPLLLHHLHLSFVLSFMDSQESTQHNIESNKFVIDDPLSPFFLRHSDNPGLVLVTQPLTGDN